ncbi:MAG: TlpA family protein disulfide reductase [Rhodocyclaceae bacterium]|jgi:peroxiredoxin|nr:TlpA family protein disulfide reductase [Rhodocyclaceae bacterium]MCL4758807.1 TlpA family protein disulfide reductase [Rhodocyclaceae bacterium]
MNRTTRLLVFAAIAATAATVGHLTYRSMEPARAAASNAAETLMALTLPDLQGKEQALEQWRGKVIVVNYWATWCPPCIKEIPEFAAVSRKFADQPVQFVGISIDTADKIEEFRRQHDVPYPLLVANHETLRLTADLGNAPQALPFTVLVDRKGGIGYAKLGTLSETELEGRIRELLPR